MSMIFYVMLCFHSFIIHGHINDSYSCEICIVDSTCTDKNIIFNLSISKYCHQPFNTDFTYHTDVHSTIHHSQTLITCADCYVDLCIDLIPQAWDYILTLKTPDSSETCSNKHVAHCGGNTCRLSWFILGGLSGIGILLGISLYSIRSYHHRQRQMKTNLSSITTNNLFAHPNS